MACPPIPWKRPTGPEVYLVPKEVRPVFDNQIATIWGKMGTGLRIPRFWYGYMDLDVVRFAEAEKDPVVFFDRR